MIGRRSLLAAGAGLALAKPALAQSRTIKFTLPYVAQGTSMFPFVGRAKGYFRERGIEIEISRGAGSIPAAQAVSTGQFDFGMAISPPLLLMIAKGLPLMLIGQVDHNSMMGIGLLADSPIKAAAGLAGTKIGSVPASAEYPFFPAYAEKVGLDLKKIEIIGTDPKLLERLLADRQVDAITGVASSSMPILLSRGISVRWLLYTSAGLPSYGTALITNPEMVRKDPALCQAIVDAMMQSLSYVLREPEEAIDIFFKELPEMGLSPGARQFVRIGMQAQQYALTSPETRTHGLGWADPGVYEAMTELVMRVAAPPGTAAPEVARWFTNRFAGNITLSESEWNKIAASGASFGEKLV